MTMVRGFQGTDPSWCNERAKLVEMFSLPSVINQTSYSFKWIFLISDETPADTLRRINKWSAKCKQMIAVPVDCLTPSKLREVIHQHLNPNTSRISTTRFDSDDALAPSFMADLAYYVESNPDFNGFVNFDNGYCLHFGKTYYYSDNSNMFYTFVDMRTREFRTPYCFSHATINEDRGIAITHLGGAPRFLVVNHAGCDSGRSRHGIWRAHKSKVERNLKLALPGPKDSPIRVLYDDMLYIAKRPLIPFVLYIRARRMQ